MNTPVIERGLVSDGGVDIYTDDKAVPHVSPRLRVLRFWYWALVPLLALAAYGPVLSLWFVGDDFNLLHWQERLPGLVPFTWVVNLFYRPLSGILTWNVGYSLFGTNALPYHLVSLVLHALTAWLFSRLVGVVSGEARIGWIAGAIFAVFPLSTEPVAWLAAQWDLWAAACGVAGMWGFAAAWRRRDWRPYAAGLAITLVGVFMKESILPLALVIPFVALATELCRHAKGEIAAPADMREWLSLGRRVLRWSVPYAGPSLLFAGFRLVTYGSVGGYAGTRVDYNHFFWDVMVAIGLQMLMPLNRLVFSQTAVQVTGLFMTGLFLVGLFLWGRKRWSLVLLATVWWLAFLVPIMNLVALDNPTRSGSRLIYMSLMGFCIALAAILAGLMDALPRRYIGWALVGGMLVLAVPATWIQLYPWQQASRQTRHLLQEIGGLVEPAPGKVLHFNVKDLPSEYKGAYVFWNGLNDAMETFNHQTTEVKSVVELDLQALAEPLDKRSGGNYNLAFSLDSKDELYHVSELSGMSVPTGPSPSAKLTWDYTKCGEGRLSEQVEWQPFMASFDCAAQTNAPPFPGTSYAALQPETADPNINLPDLTLDPSGAKWVRLAVLARLPEGDEGLRGEWFWGSMEQPAKWSGERNSAFLLDANPEWRTYWTYIRADKVKDGLHGLRFDPVNAQVQVDIAWISISLMP
jgi:hypothetical protein